MPTDLSPEEFRRLGYRAIDLLAEHLAALPDGPCRTPVPDAARRALLEQPVPRHGMDADLLLDEVASTIVPYPMGNSSPRFFAWVNSPATPLAVIGELLAAGLNPSVAGGDHAATYVEHAALGWMRTLVRFPEQSGGILTSGGSVANLLGLAVMRHVKTGGRVREHGIGGAPSNLVVYTSSEGHSCLQKAIEILGIGHAHLRRIPVDADWRMNVGELERQVAADRAADLTPACVAASAGTVNTGAIDPLGPIGALCQREHLWFHVDAAYGGPAALVPEVAALYDGIDGADSVAIDPHKWMYVPVECGCALVRDPRAMRDTFSLVPPYLRDDTALPWFSEFGIQQSRGFRALKLWMALRHAGLDGYQRAIAHDIAMARALQERLRLAADFELVSAGPLSITCFRYSPDRVRGRDEEVDRLNRRVLDTVQREGRVYLTGTELRQRLALRACIVNFRTQESDLDALIDAVRRAGEP
jgi:aromatic-L-amino-acid decarboxylase